VLEMMPLSRLHAAEIRRQGLAGLVHVSLLIKHDDDDVVKSLLLPPLLVHPVQFIVLDEEQQHVYTVCFPKRHSSPLPPLPAALHPGTTDFEQHYILLTH
jgi:hypothetical protein